MLFHQLIHQNAGSSSPAISGGTIGGIIAGVVIIVVAAIGALLIYKLKTHSENLRPPAMVESHVGQESIRETTYLHDGVKQQQPEFNDIPGGRTAKG